ncbi:hypothetical protein [Acinetobacter gyllenbergii]|uniref:hypothetical protein n=1 Tax=Acinetobacter gyllenbergii TaxID=134534 RepID=UPI0003BF1D68|nr:hypothetical protein [Acinetobacter gyllenbergii]ESK50750.1 hypothetical protein F987_01482 [Acinetobacter gyllenbergii NIPH 230]
MKKIFIILCLLPNFAYAEEPMQPPLVEYNYCNAKGTFCSKSEVTHYYENGQKNSSVGGIDEANSDQLLNLDHYYRNQCKIKFGIPLDKSVPRDKFKQWGECLVGNISNSVKNRNQENQDYLEKTKKIFE